MQLHSLAALSHTSTGLVCHWHDQRYGQQAVGCCTLSFCAGTTRNFFLGSLLITMIMGMLRCIDHALAPPTGRQARGSPQGFVPLLK